MFRVLPCGLREPYLGAPLLYNGLLSVGYSIAVIRLPGYSSDDGGGTTYTIMSQHPSQSITMGHILDHFDAYKVDAYSASILNKDTVEEHMESHR